MTTKSLFNVKNSFRYLYIFILLLNLLALYFMYDFADKNVISAIKIDSSEILDSNKSSEDINMERFDNIIKNIKNKTSSYY